MIAMEKRFEIIQENLTEEFRFSHFLKLTDFLTELITKETGYLKMVKIQEVDEMRPIKQKACDLYANIIGYLRENKDSLQELSVQERKILKEVTENLSRLLDRNEKMIRSFNEANKRVMEIFHEVIQSRMSTNYGPEGKKRPPLNGYSNFSQRG